MLASLLLATAAPSFPIGPAQAVCQLSQKTPERDQAEFWRRVDADLKLTDRQRIELRIFCLGFTHGQLAAMRKPAR